MFDDEEYTNSLRQSQNTGIKRALGKDVRAGEIHPLALILGLAQPDFKLVARTEAEIEKIRSSKKYKSMSIAERLQAVAPRRIGGGSTENQLVRRLFSLAEGAKTRVLLPERIVGQSRLTLSEIDPDSYTRVVLAQGILTGLDYITDKKGDKNETEFRFNWLAEAVNFVEFIDTVAIDEGNPNEIARLEIVGSYGDWTVKQTRYETSGEARKDLSRDEKKEELERIREQQAESFTRAVEGTDF